MSQALLIYIMSGIFIAVGAFYIVHSFQEKRRVDRELKEAILETDMILDQMIKDQADSSKEWDEIHKNLNDKISSKKL